MSSQNDSDERASSAWMLKAREGEPQMGMTSNDIQNAVLRYERELDRYTKLADLVYERCLRLVDEIGIRATVQRRAKSPQSLRKKLLRIERQDPPDGRFTTLDDVFANMSDLAAVRVATYLESDRSRIVAELRRVFEFAPGRDGHPNPDDKSRNDRAKHYRAVHCQVLLKPEDSAGRNANLAGTSCEIQVCSMLAHVWNEIEHDLGYKPETGKLSERELDCLDALGQLIRAGDVIIKTLLDANLERVAASETRFGNSFDFTARMQKHFPEADDFGSHAAQLFDVLLEMGLDSPKKVRDALLDESGSYQSRAMELIANLQHYLQRMNDDVVTIGPQTSDQLAVLLLEKRADDLISRYPAGRGMGRPMRLVSLAKRFKEMRTADT